MPKARITRSTIEKLEVVPGKQTIYFDTKLTGFGVKVNSSSRTYIVQCRVKGKFDDNGKPLQIYESIGRVDIIDYEKALDRAKKILEDATLGISPEDRRKDSADEIAAVAAHASAERDKDITLDEMFIEYLDTRKKLKQSTKDLYREDLDRYIGDWLKLPIRSITGSMVVKKHAEIGKRSKSRADGVMRVVRAICYHAINLHEGLLTSNPVKKLSAVNAWYNVPRKESYIHPDQLKAWFQGFFKLHRDTAQDFILLMLFLGSRKTETSSLQWKEVNLTAGTIKFRETKTGIVLEIPIPKFIIGRLEERYKYYYDGPESFVFPSYGECGHVTRAAESLLVIYKHSGVKASHHDLRRSFISYCEELEINVFSRKRLVNHAIPLDVTEGYTMFNMNKLREIVERIAAFILHHAGIQPIEEEAPPLTEEQAAKLAQTDFWNNLNEAQREQFKEIMTPKKEEHPNVISLDAIKIQRRMVR